MSFKNLLILSVLIVCSIGFTGCQNITPQDLQTLTARQTELNQQIDTMQAAADELADDMAEAGIVDPNTVQRIAKINAEADKVQAQVDAISAAVSNVKLTGDTGQDWISLLQAANAASAPVNPYALPIGAVISLVGVIFGFLKKKEAAQKTTALTEVINGGEIFKKSATPEAVAAFKTAQNEAQKTPTTKQQVAVIKVMA